MAAEIFFFGYFFSKQRGQQSVLLTVRTDWHLCLSEMLEKRTTALQLLTFEFCIIRQNPLCTRSASGSCLYGILCEAGEEKANSRRGTTHIWNYTHLDTSSHKLKCTFNAFLVILYTTSLSFMPWRVIKHPGHDGSSGHMPP